MTVFGFPVQEKEKTLQEFRRLGAVLQEVYDGYNFAHIQYANAELAEGACRHGSQPVLSRELGNALLKANCQTLK